MYMYVKFVVIMCITRPSVKITSFLCTRLLFLNTCICINKCDKIRTVVAAHKDMLFVDLSNPPSIIIVAIDLNHIVRKFGEHACNT